MSAANPEWPGLLRDYETAIAGFDAVSRALTSALVGRSGVESASNEDFGALIAAEERARETVILARIRIINLWRESGVEPPGFPAPMPTAPLRDR
jgi:hypothetical protein